MSLTDCWASVSSSPAAKILQRGFLNERDLRRISIQFLKERVLQHRGQQETAIKMISTLHIWKENDDEQVRAKIQASRAVERRQVKA